MEDESIIKLYLLRSETAINETDKKYHDVGVKSTPTSDFSSLTTE